jgi:hypothetical protein
VYLGAIPQAMSAQADVNGASAASYATGCSLSPASKRTAFAPAS